MKQQILNIVNRAHFDYTTTYDVSDGDTEFIFPVSTNGSIRIDVVAGEFDYPSGTTLGTDLSTVLDGTLAFYTSADGVNKQIVDGASTITLDAAQKVSGWEEDQFEANYAHIVFTQNTLVAGTVRLLATLKF